MAIYGYIRISPKMKDADDRIEQFTQTYSDIVVFKEQGIRGNVPLDERPEFTKLNEKLTNGDELIVWWVDEFGKDFLMSSDNIATLIQKGITIKTINQSLEFKADDTITDSLVKMMKGYAESEKHRRLFAAKMGRKALKEDAEKWKEKFKGRPGDEQRHADIAQALFEGKTLEVVAEETGASISTVKRVKAKLREHDELGQMRGRGKGKGMKGRGGRGDHGRGEHGRGESSHGGRGERGHGEHGHGEHGHHKGERKGRGHHGRSENAPAVGASAE